MAATNCQAAHRIGVSASPSVKELKSLAVLVCDNLGINLGPNRINRLAVDFARQFPTGSGWMFFLHLANDVLRVSESQHRRLLINPDIARVISYTDRTGEEAVTNVMRELKTTR